MPKHSTTLSSKDTAKKEGVASLQSLAAIIEIVGEDPSRALGLARVFLTQNSDLPAAWRTVALATRAAGDLAAAERLDMEAIAAGSRFPGLASAEDAFAGGRIEEAERLVRAYLRDVDPKDAGAALLLGKIALHCGANAQAENLARRSLLIAPGFDEARFVLARVQYETGDMVVALGTLADLLGRDSGHLRGLSLKAAILVQLRRMKEADETFRTLHERHPDDSRGWMNHAFMLKTIGRRTDAVEAYRRAIATEESNGQAWWGLVNLRTEVFRSADLEAMDAALNRDNLSDEQRIHFYFALGKMLEGHGRYDEAFTHFSAGAALRLAQAPHNPASVDDNVARVTEVFTRKFFADRDGWGCPADDPIFIVSLPRSGSTLIEQVLASHSAIEGTEELFDIERIALQITGDSPHGYIDRVASLNKKEVHDLGEAYLSSTSRFRTLHRPRFTDKMPSNWVYIGLIRLILPNARIIDIRRHPLGCGLANFTQHFSWGINFSYSLEHIGQFYSAYVRQMAHFEHATPGYVHHLTYESVIDELEIQVRRMLRYLGLPFEQACLKFRETVRAIHTPSSEQVRRPINRDGVDRWRHYERWLDPLKAALGPVLESYPLPPPV